jgi:hypothetical protein
MKHTAIHHAIFDVSSFPLDCTCSGLIGVGTVVVLIS